MALELVWAELVAIGLPSSSRVLFKGRPMTSSLVVKSLN